MDRYVENKAHKIPGRVWQEEIEQVSGSSTKLSGHTASEPVSWD